METDTLMIRNFPVTLTANEQEDLLRYFGATQVHCMGTRGPMKHTAFAKFQDKECANEALQRLHQQELLGRTLIVQFAKDHQTLFQECPPPPKVKDKTSKNEKEIIKQKAVKREDETDKKITEKINSISANLGIKYSYSPQLEYMYPSPTVSILTNIANALASVPKFYVQVLHLMNKMNLPAPFGAITPTPPLPVEPPEEEVPAPPPEEPASDEESEMESEEEDQAAKLARTANLKRPAAINRENKPRKKFKLQHLQPVQPKTSTDSGAAPVKPEEVFDTAVPAPVKKIEFNLSQSKDVTDSITAAPPESVPDAGWPSLGDGDILKLIETRDQENVTAEEPTGFGKFQPTAKEDSAGSEDDGKDDWEESEFISDRRLRKGRISGSEMRSISVFKRYEEGEPTSRLYIKNLAKQVTEKDLHYVFGRYVKWDIEAEKIMFDIRLMKEGRMKGQAFVTLPSAEVALKAVRDTNGYEMKGKPLVVQFARSAKPKDSDTKGKK